MMDYLSLVIVSTPLFVVDRCLLVVSNQWDLYACYQIVVLE